MYRYYKRTPRFIWMGSGRNYDAHGAVLERHTVTDAWFWWSGNEVAGKNRVLFRTSAYYSLYKQATDKLSTSNAGVKYG
jgi:hypothetical protein